jgi:hypothetical protein
MSINDEGGVSEGRGSVPSHGSAEIGAGAENTAPVGESSRIEHRCPQNAFEKGQVNALVPVRSGGAAPHAVDFSRI